MYALQKMKFSNGITAGPVSSNATAVGTYVDTAGANYLLMVFTLGTTTADMDAIKLQESATTSGFTDISGAALTGATFSSTADGSIGIIGLPIDGSHLRYINVVADPGAAATIMNVTFILEGLTQSPNTATERGVLEQVFLP